MQRADSLEKTLMLGKIQGKTRKWQQRMRQLDAITDSMDIGLSKVREMVKDRKAWHAAVHGITSMSQQTNNNNNQHCIINLPDEFLNNFKIFAHFPWNLWQKCLSLKFEKDWTALKVFFHSSFFFLCQVLLLFSSLAVFVFNFILFLNFTILYWLCQILK